MARITREEVLHVADLARLSLSEPEVEQMTGELSGVLSYAELLSEVPTEGIEPTSHVIPMATPMRDDRAAPPMDPELALTNAPVRADSAFVVPRVIESEDEG